MSWQLALAQHPMYFLIKEDEFCAERTPPWGAPDVAAYTERLRRVFAGLRRHPQLKIGFEWSGLELEHLARDARPVFDEMLSLAAQGQIAFYNGTYAQPHLQTLSAEANYRQFEFGARVYRELCGQRVRVYAHQETSFNEQTPQLLKAFGLEFVVLPHFLATLVLEDVELGYHPRAGATFVQGSEFVRWRGLDGTLINTYLRAPLPRSSSLPDWLAGQQVQGPLAAPPILVDTPDLIEMDEAWLAARASFEFVLLDEALPRRLQQAPARGHARLFSNWSYIEGIRAEELARANWLAERAALRAEAMGALAFVLIGRSPDSVESVWRTILTTQHHDVYCFCAPDLKRKSIGWLRAAEEQARQLTQAAAAAILPRISAPETAGEPVVVFNTLPHPVAAPVTIDTRVPNPALRDAAGRPLPCEVEAADDGASRVTFVAQAAGLGYSTLVLTPQAAALALAETDDPLLFENDFYQAVTRPDGTLASLRPAHGGPELLAAGPAGAGALAGLESAGTESPTAGTALAWQPDGPVRVRRSDLGARLCVAGRLGRAVQVSTTIQFYHQLPWIDLTWTFDFDRASLGDFYEDESKLRVKFPLAFHGQIHHDIAFGVTTSLEDRPFFPANWVDISDGAAGLAYFHQGTLKHWVTGDVLTNLLAWGEDTDAIGNRLGPGRWPKRFDQRLVGRHTIRAALYPHLGDWRAAGVVDQARNFAVPPLAFVNALAAGPLPPSLNLFELRSPYLAATAVTAEASQVSCRFYSYASQPQPVALHLEKMSLAGLTNLSGEALEQIGPFQIGQLWFEPQR